MTHILRSERQGWLLWTLTLVFLTGVALAPRLRARGWRRQWGFALLVLIHPGWWMSARTGDCGRTLVEGSLLITAVAIVMGTIVFFRSRRTIPTSAPRADL